MKILVPLDKSHRDGIVLPYSATAAQAFQASITLVHVIPFQRAIVPGAVREADAYLLAVQEGLLEKGISAESIARKGDPAGVILGLVEECEADMIVMASRGRSGLGKFVLGSVADAVLGSSGRPVLLLSESTRNVQVDEKIRQQSAYLATVLWNKQAKGHCTGAEAKRQLEMLAAAGLDREVLFSSHETLEQQGGIPFGWLDIDFQLNTLRTFLPDEMDAVPHEASPQTQRERAA